MVRYGAPSPDAYDAPGTTGSPAGGAAWLVRAAPEAMPLSVRSSTPATSADTPMDRFLMPFSSLEEWRQRSPQGTLRVAGLTNGLPASLGSSSGRRAFESWRSLLAVQADGRTVTSSELAKRSIDSR